MDKGKKEINIIVAEDDSDDFYLIKKVLGEFFPELHTTWVKDGEELTDFLLQGRHKKYGGDHLPVILLDLNMPRKDGRQALEEIKANAELCLIPVIVFTTSDAPADARNVYKLGAAAYVLKPSTYPEYVSFAKSLKNWLERISLPLKETY